MQRQELQRTEREDTDVEEKSRISSHYQSKLFIGYLKVLPMLIAGLYLLNTALSYFDIDLPVISYMANFLLWLFVMMASYRLHFCEYHRMFLWYIFTNNVICVADFEVGLPISNWNYFILHIIVVGIFLFLILYFHQKCKRKG